MTSDNECKDDVGRAFQGNYRLNGARQGLPGELGCSSKKKGEERRWLL